MRLKHQKIVGFLVSRKTEQKKVFNKFRNNLELTGPDWVGLIQEKGLVQELDHVAYASTKLELGAPLKRGVRCTNTKAVTNRVVNAVRTARHGQGK